MNEAFGEFVVNLHVERIGHAVLRTISLSVASLADSCLPGPGRRR